MRNWTKITKREDYAAQEGAREKLDKNRRHKRWMRAVSVLASVMVFVTTYSMILPTLTATRTDLPDDTDANEVRWTRETPAWKGELLALHIDEAEQTARLAVVVDPRPEEETPVVTAAISTQEIDVDALAAAGVLVLQDDADVNAHADTNININANASAAEALPLAVSPAAEKTTTADEAGAEAPAAEAARSADAPAEAAAETAILNGPAALVELPMDSEAIEVLNPELAPDYPTLSEDVEALLKDVKSAGILEAQDFAALVAETNRTLEIIETPQAPEEADAAEEETAAADGQDAADAALDADAAEDEADAAVDEEDDAAMAIADEPNSDADAVTDAETPAEADSAIADADAEAAGEDPASEAAETAASQSIAGAMEQAAAEIREADGVLTASGEDYLITVTYGPDAQIPAAAALTVKEIGPEDEDYAEYYAQSLATLDATDERKIEDAETVSEGLQNAVEALAEKIENIDIESNDSEETIAKSSADYARIFDIEIWDGEQKIEPAASVAVNIKLLDAPVAEEATPQVVHFAETGAEKIDLTEATATQNTDSIQFETDAFSVYSVVYTVDFHWEVDGETYDFSIPGGGFVSFTDLVQALGIADDAKKFTADVADVQFSNPELVWVGKIEENTTVGAIKDGFNLACEYSADLTEEQIAEINAQTVEAGDWALIARKAFDTEESLTVTMKTGEVFVIKVTDAQDSLGLDGKSFTISYSDSGTQYSMICDADQYTGGYRESLVSLITSDNSEKEKWTFKLSNQNNYYYLQSKDGKYLKLGGSRNTDLSLVQSQSQATLFSVTQNNNSYTITSNNNIPLAYYSNGNYTPFFMGKVDHNTWGQPQTSLILTEYVTTVNPDPVGDWLLYFDDDFSEITIHEGETITLRPYNKWEWKEGNVDVQKYHWNVDGKSDWNDISASDKDQSRQSKWSSGGSNGVAGFDWVAYVKNDTQLDTHYWAVQGRATATGDYKLTNTKNNKTIIVHVVDGKPVNQPKPIEKTANIKVNLFDYDRYGLLDGSYDESKNWWKDDNIANNNNNKNDSTNAMNGGSHFYFMSSGGGNNGNQYHWNDYTKDAANPGIVNQTLTDGYPTLAGSGQKNQSLQYLFDASKKTWNGGNNNDGMIAYPDVTGMFQKDENGYYYFNSNTNYFYYNTETGESKLYEHTYTQTLGQAKGSLMNDKPIGFFPFKDYDSTSDLSVNQNHNLNHHIGLSMDIDFYIPMNRLDDKNQPIEFDFSGDDDLWVFVEWTDEKTKEKKSKLLLDLGGIHQPVTGKIDFTNDAAIKNLLPGGKNYTLKVFYLERGGCDSNCSIRFNLPLAKELTVAKKLNGLTPTERQKYLRDKFVYEIGFKKDNDEYEVPNYSDNDQYWKDEDNNPNTQPEWRSHFDLYKTTKETKDDSNHTVSYRWNSTHTALEKQTGEAVKDGRIELIADESFTISQLRREDIFYLAEEHELDMDQFETPHAERLFFDLTDQKDHEEEVHLHEDHAKNDNKADWETKPYALLDTEKLVYTNTLLEQNIDVWKEWHDNDASDRPGEVEFKLVATVDGEPYTQETGHDSINAQWTETKNKVAYTKTGNVLTGEVDGSTSSESNEYPYKLNEANGWHMSFEHLPKKTESPTGEGKDIVYSIVEKRVDGYTTSSDGLVDTDEVYLDLFKFWPDDNSNHAGDKKEDINVKIQTKMGDTIYYVVAEDPRMANGEYKFKEFTKNINQATDFPLVTKDSYGTINNLQDMFDYSTRVSAPKTYTFGEGENAKTYTPEYKLTEPVDKDDSTKGTVLFTRPKQEWRILNSKGTTDITVKKTDSTKSGDQRFIAGAKFSLYKAGTPDELITAPVIKNAGTNAAIELDSQSKFEIPVEGITISGLQDGSYKLVELEAPAGYVITNNTTTFTVSGGKVTAWNLTGTAGNTLEIPNTPGIELPSTGGPGTAPFTAVGALLITAAGIFVIRRKRRGARIH